MTQSDFIVKFFSEPAPHQPLGSRPAGSVRGLTAKGHQFLGRSHHCLHVTGEARSISELWTLADQLGRFFHEAVEAGCNFSVIQS